MAFDVGRYLENDEEICLDPGNGMDGKAKTALARSLSVLPVVPFIDACFTSQDASSLVKPSTLLDIYSTIPNLRRIRSFQDDFDDDGWYPSDFLGFIDDLKGIWLPLHESSSSGYVPLLTSQ